jgi:L-galactose dehydrogenase
LEVSVLGFGASPLGGSYQEMTEEHAVATVREAFAQGINYFDTSPYYGDGLSEERLGKGLQGLPRDQVIVATKMGRYGMQLFDFAAERVREGVKESLARMQLDYIDILQAHDIEFRSLDQIVNETIPALVQLRDEGLIRKVGITGLPLAIYKKVLDRVPPGSVDCILSYCHNSLSDSSLLQLLPYLKEKGVGIISASPMSMGLLAGHVPDWHPAPADVRQTCSKAVQHAQQRGVALPTLALKHSLTVSPDIAVTLTGMASPEQVRANVQTVLDALGVTQEGNFNAQLEGEVLQEVQDILKPIKDKTWPSGRQENN